MTRETVTQSIASLRRRHYGHPTTECDYDGCSGQHCAECFPAFTAEWPCRTIIALNALERELAEAEQQLVAQWLERLACPCGAYIEAMDGERQVPHAPSCPTARALERQR